MKFKLLGILSFSILLVIFGSSVAFAQETPEEIAKKHGISFPIAELGGCVDYSSCRTYCEDPINQSQCIDFAKKKGFYKEEDNAQSQNTRMLSAKAELGCDSEASCREFCGSQANWEKCGEFAKKHRLSGGHIEDPKKAEILKQAKEELGCTSYESCMAFCHKEANAQKCSEFAKKVGLRGGEVHAGPGGCTSEETCKKVCSDPSNYEICNKFTSAEGGKFHGPGGCTSEESCKAYCQQHPQECGHIGASIRYDSLQEMCSRTPNCSWTDNSCQCRSPGTAVRGPGYESKYCKEFPDKCAIPSQHVVITPSEEYCKSHPQECEKMGGMGPREGEDGLQNMNQEDFCRQNPDKCHAVEDIKNQQPSQHPLEDYMQEEQKTTTYLPTPTGTSYLYPSPIYGTPSYVYPSPSTTYGTPFYLTPTYGTPSYGTPAYGSPFYGTPNL